MIIKSAPTEAAFTSCLEISTLSKIEPDMVAAGQYIVGTLIHAGVVTAEKADLAVQIVAEELQVWLAIRELNSAKPN